MDTVPLPAITSLATLTAAFPGLQWCYCRLIPGQPFIQMAYAALERRGDGYQVYLVGVEEGFLPPHQHLGLPEEREVEKTIILAGEMDDRSDDGTDIVLRPGQHVVHAGGTVHSPLVPKFAAAIIRVTHGLRFMSPVALASV